MWALSLAIYFGCKWLTWRRTPVHGVPWWQHLAYLFAWPGLDPAAFLKPRCESSPSRPPAREWFFALGNLALGLVCFFGLANRLPAEHPYAIGWVAMIGIVLMLHFGIFQLLSCVWRMSGIEARPLMDNPLASVSLSEFWGRRWNTAFRDLTHRFLFRPLVPWLGPRWAVFAGFVFSGLVHDLVISVPAEGGYGGPTLYFLLQGAGLLIERAPIGKRLGLGRSWQGWLFTMVLLLGPVCLLFHPPFVVGVIVPFLHFAGGD